MSQGNYTHAHGNVPHQIIPVDIMAVRSFPDASRTRSRKTSVGSSAGKSETGGTYVSFQTEEEGGERILAAYGNKYHRLAQVKSK